MRSRSLFRSRKNREHSAVRGLYLAAACTALLFLCELPAACQAQNGEIVVGAAISLKEAFNELGDFYQRRTGTKVDFTFAASGELVRQIEAGAPIDVFASAAEREMDELQNKKLIDAKTRADFARNTLVLVVPAKSQLRLQTFSGLAAPGIKKIAIGNPRTVPAGLYAQQLLQKLQLWSKVESRLIVAENVRQVLDYVSRDEVDAGIVYGTDVQAAHGTVRVAARADDRDYGPILYPLAAMQNSAHGRAARGFVDFVSSPEGARVLSKHGFQPAK
jgi:molybdate transport system substrate-binding protein